MSELGCALLLLLEGIRHKSSVCVMHLHMHVLSRTLNLQIIEKFGELKLIGGMDAIDEPPTAES